MKSYQILVELLRFKKSLHVYKLSQKLCTSLPLFRIKEIINASKKISTPIVTAHLEDPLDPEFARLVDLSQEVERQTLFRVLFAKFRVVFAKFRVYLLNLVLFAKFRVLFAKFIVLFAKFKVLFARFRVLFARFRVLLLNI